MQVACCQLDIAWEDKAANYRKVESLVAAAKLAPGTLLLLPEMFATGFTMNAEAVAEAIDGPTAAFLADLAKRYGVTVQGGVVIRGPGDAKPRNMALVFDAEGKMLACYAKMHLFSFAGEPTKYAPGDAPVVFQWQDATVAPAICYDLRFPELFRHAVKDRAQVLSIIACWPAAREEHWLTLLRARAIENQCFVAAVNRCGHDPSGLIYSGRSQIIGPRGTILADGGTDEGIIQAPIDLEAQRRDRQKFPALDDRRL